MRITTLLSILPFISFMAGYCILQSYFGKTTTSVPCLIGKQLHEAVCVLSDQMLVSRIIAEKEYSHVPAGTVMQQQPEPYTCIRSNQTILLVISKLPEPLRVPLVVGKTIDESTAQLKRMGLQSRVYEIESDDQVQGTCVAQWPSPQSEVTLGSTMILYAVKNIKKPLIVPHFRGKRIEMVKEICEKHGIHCQVIHTVYTNEEHECSNCFVINQRPLSGTILPIDTAKRTVFQFQV